MLIYQNFLFSGFFLFYKNDLFMFNQNYAIQTIQNSLYTLSNNSELFSNFDKSFILFNLTDGLYNEKSHTFLVNFNYFNTKQNNYINDYLNIFLFTFNENSAVVHLKKKNNYNLRHDSVRVGRYKNPKNFIKNIKYIFNKDLDSYFFYKNNNTFTKEILYNTYTNPDTNSFVNISKKINKNSSRDFFILSKYGYLLDNIKSLLYSKYKNFNKNIKNKQTTDNILLVKFLLNFSNLSKIKKNNYYSLDYGQLSYKIRGKNLNYFKNNIFKFIDNFYFNKNYYKKNNNKFILNFKFTVSLPELFKKSFYFVDSKKNLTINPNFNECMLNYKYKKFVNSFVFVSDNDLHLSSSRWYFADTAFVGKKYDIYFSLKKIPKYVISIFRPVRSFFIQNTNNFIFNNYGLNRIVKNNYYLFNYKQKNILYFDNLKELSSEVDKSFKSLYLFGSTLLPWFEYTDVEDKLYDLSYFLNFSENSFTLENINENFISNTVYNKEVADSIKIYKKYIKINKLLKKNNINFYNKRSKKNVWKIPVRWHFDTNFEKFIRFNYKNTLSCFYEKKYKLRRNLLLSDKFVISSPRIENNLGISNFNNLDFSVYSNQNYKFGVLFNDIFFEDSNISNIIFLPKSGSLAFLNSKKLNFDLPPVEFSFKESNDSLKNFSTVKSLVKFSPFYSKSINTEIFSNFFLKKKKLLNIIKNKTASDSDKHSSNFLHKIDKFYVKEKKIIKKKINRYDYSLKSFWNPNNTFNFVIQNPNDDSSFFINKDRFLGTFDKKIRVRNIFLSNQSNRIDSLKTEDKLIKKLINNNFRLLPLNGKLKESGIVFNSMGRLRDDWFSEKFYIQEDKEVSAKFMDKNKQKPHTFYGYIWDEYLKQSYGFSLNFLNFTNSTFSNLKSNKLKFSNMSSRDNQKRIENATISINNFTGMTKDSELSATILSKFLTSSGFVKEIHNFENLDEDFYKRKKAEAEDDIKSIKKQKKKSKRKKKLKFKKYFKRELIRSTIYKSKLIKKSINLIKKYDEIPVGFKYNSTKNSINFPYFKKFFKIVNEQQFIDNIYFKKDNWLSDKNDIINYSSRSNIAKYSKLKKKNKLTLLFGGKRKKRRFRLNRNIYLNKYFDLSFLSFKNKNKKLILFLDKFSEDSPVNALRNKIKRNLKKLKPKNRILKHRLRRVKNTSLLSFKKNRNKKLKNYRLNEKFSHNLDIFFGGGLPIKNNSISKVNEIPLLAYNFENRLNFNFDDYYRFHNNPVFVESGSDFLFSNKLLSFNLYKYKSLRKKKYDFEFNLNSLIKKNQPDSIFFENLLAKQLYKTDKISEIYLESSYASPEYQNFYKNYNNLYCESGSLDIVLDSNFYKKNDIDFFNIDGEVVYSYTSKNYEYLFYNKKTSNYSGLSDKQINSFLFLNYNLSSVLKKKTYFDKKKKNNVNFDIYFKFFFKDYLYLLLLNYTFLYYFYTNLGLFGYFLDNKLKNLYNCYYKNTVNSDTKITTVDFDIFLNKKIINLPKNKKKLNFYLFKWLWKKIILINFILFLKIYIIVILFLFLNFLKKKKW